MARTTRSTGSKSQDKGDAGEVSDKPVKAASAKPKTTRRNVASKTELASSAAKPAAAKATASRAKTTPRKAAPKRRTAAAAPPTEPPKVAAPQVRLEDAASVSSPTIDASPISDPAAVMREAMKIGASAPAAQRLAENIERIEALSHRLMAAFTARGLPNPGVEGPGPELFMTATNAWMKTITEQPGRMIEQQVNFWGQTLKNYANAQSAMAKGRFNLPEDDEESRGRKDKRFANELWQTHPYFKLVKISTTPMSAP